MKMLLAALLWLGCVHMNAQTAPAAGQTTPAAAQTTAKEQPVPPELADKPLPALSDLIEAVEKHEDRDEAILQQYTYHGHVLIEGFDGKSAVKKTSTYDFESIPINGIRIEKLVARDGKPLPPDEAQKVSEAFDKAAANGEKRHEKYEEKKAQAEKEGKSNKDFLPASRILQLGTLSNERRVLFNGRPTIVFDYRGSHDAKAKDEFEKAVEDLVGTCWIDEEDKVIAHAEGHFLADYKIGLGLVADIHKDLSFTWEQQKVNGEVWLMKNVDWVGKASFGWLLVRINGHRHEEISDYRKFRTEIKIVGSNGEVGPDGKPIAPPDTAQPPAATPH